MHVDIIENRWTEHQQRLVARVRADHGVISVESVDDQTDRCTYLKSLADEVPSGDNRSMLLAFKALFWGSHLVASEVHDTASCAFRDTHWVAMERRLVARPA